MSKVGICDGWLLSSVRLFINLMDVQQEYMATEYVLGDEGCHGHRK